MSTLTFCGYAFLHLNMELLLQFQHALQRTLDLVIIQDIAIPLPGGRIRHTDKDVLGARPNITWYGVLP